MVGSVCEIRANAGCNLSVISIPGATLSCGVISGDEMGTVPRWFGGGMELHSEAASWCGVVLGKPGSEAVEGPFCSPMALTSQL